MTNHQSIAEIGQTHRGSPQLALHTIREFADAGAWGVKFQALQPDSLVQKAAKPYWTTTRYADTQHESFARAGVFDYDVSLWKRLRDEAHKAGVAFVVTPFDLQAVVLCKTLDVNAVKIASGDITNWQLIRAVHDLMPHTPLILSTGASSDLEIRRAVAWSWSKANLPRVLACNLSYPTDMDHANLGRVTSLRKLLPDHLVGYSDHTYSHPGEVGFALGALGVSLFERHVSTKEEGGEVPDDDMAATPAEFEEYLDGWRRGASLYGDSVLRANPTETPARVGARRCLYWAKDKQYGDDVHRGDTIALRPWTQSAVPAEQEPQIIGRTRLSSGAKKGTPVVWGDLQDLGSPGVEDEY